MDFRPIEDIFQLQMWKEHQSQCKEQENVYGTEKILNQVGPFPFKNKSEIENYIFVAQARFRMEVLRQHLRE
ncbi:hypothetical protein [Flavobacterium sp. ZS1P14]|uniref:hypothetical protein n=1 Tax=Flavobacterium sp. ZS1P14 TaxID=3401729 RepID=UPI003AACC4EA